MLLGRQAWIIAWQIEAKLTSSEDEIREDRNNVKLSGMYFLLSSEEEIVLTFGKYTLSVLITSISALIIFVASSMMFFFLSYLTHCHFQNVCVQLLKVFFSGTLCLPFLQENLLNFFHQNGPVICF